MVSGWSLGSLVCSANGSDVEAVSPSNFQVRKIAVQARFKLGRHALAPQVFPIVRNYELQFGRAECSAPGFTQLHCGALRSPPFSEARRPSANFADPNHTDK